MPASADLVERARQRWNAGDLAGYLTLYSDQVRLYGASPEPMGKEQIAGFYATIWSALGAPGRPNPRLEFHEVLVDGDPFSCRFTMTGEHRGDFLGVPATGRPYQLPGITIMRFRGEQIVERWSSADFLGLLVQFGAVPTPAG
ncbi:ester cyclase [Modestobacter sp. URMC 112]